MKKTTLYVSDLMQTKVENFVLINEVEVLKEALFEKFLEGTLFVVSEDYKLYGILTDGDIRRNIAKKEPIDIKKIITKAPKTIHPDEEAAVALRMLKENDINILPVVSENEQLVGFITLHILVNSFSPERLYITKTKQTIDANTNRHIARYKFALNFIKQNSISLDCACGSGYGSKIIALKSDKVLAVDISKEAICFAKKENNTSNIEFIQKDISSLEFEASFFDSIVSIETLEHIPFQCFSNFLSNINIWLKKGGIFIGSSPMLRYKDGKPFITNPYHINEMPKEIFQQEIKNKLNNFTIHYYYQHENTFLPMQDENTGFCIVVARKNSHEL